MKNQKIILKIILNLIIIFTAIIIILLNYNIKQKSKIYYISRDIENEENMIDKNEFFIIQNCLEKYQKNLIELNIQKISEKNKRIEILYNLTPKGYLENKKINKNNLLNNLIINNMDEEFIINDIKKYSGELDKYYISVYSDTLGDNIELQLFLDKINNTFAIWQYYENEGTEESEIENYNIDYIEKNKYNIFENKIYNDEYICNYYFNNYINLIKYRKYEEAYNLINSESRSTEFSDYENFYTYIMENLDDIKNSKIEKFDIIKNEENTQYVCVNQNKIMFTFIPKNIISYEVIWKT